MASPGESACVMCSHGPAKPPHSLGALPGLRSSWGPHSTVSLPCPQRPPRREGRKGAKLKGALAAFIREADTCLNGLEEGRSHADLLLFGGRFSAPPLTTHRPFFAMCLASQALGKTWEDTGPPRAVVSYRRMQVGPPFARPEAIQFVQCKAYPKL